MYHEIRRLYPGGKRRAFNISYDDGILQDMRFVELLNRYSLKGTFNLNSGLMDPPFTWAHECGMNVTRLTPAAIRELYRGHEVASHTLTHPYMHDLSEDEVTYQLGADKQNLENLLGTEIAGFAVPFMYYSELIARCAQDCGFEYARISEESHSYEPSSDYFHWKGSIFHWTESLEYFVEGFLHTDTELALCQIVGHSYDLDVFDMWDRMEAILQKVSGNSSIWPATHLEIVRYLKAMEHTAITGGSVCNHSDVDLWFCVDGQTICLHPGEAIA